MAEIINVTRSSLPPFEEYCAEISTLWESRWLTNFGSKHSVLESELCQYLGSKFVNLFVNGHAALECAIEGLGLGDDGRNEVITTPFTFASTTHAILRKGLKPVFADVKVDDCTVDPCSIESLVTDKTCAILPVHVYGNPCDVGAIQQIADTHGLKVIYDAAHAFGVRVNGVPISHFGDAVMFSFHATKVFNSIEGGAVCHSDSLLYDRLIQGSNFGFIDAAHSRRPGGNAKLNEFAAAMGICNLRHVDEEIRKRRRVAERYWELLDDTPGLKLFKPASNVTSNYAYFPIVIDPRVFGATRDDVAEALARENIFARRYFYPLTSEQVDCGSDCDADSTPIARDVSRRILTLPLFADLALEDVERICALILNEGSPVGKGKVL